MIRASSVVVLGLVGLSACLPEFEQIQGERVLYEYNDSLHPCAGNALYMDKLVPFLERQLAVDGPELLRFSWITESDHKSLLGAQMAAGPHAWSNDPIQVHELTHAITGGMPAMFFTEGVAVAVQGMGDDISPRYPVSDDDLSRAVWNPRTTMTAIVSGDVNYGAAGVFVSYLLVLYGPEKFHEFYRGLGGPVTMTWLGGQFRRAYGRELDDEIDAFRRAIPPCDADVHPLMLPECSGPGIAWNSESEWEHEISMACDDPGIVGGIGPDYVWPSFYAVTLDVPTPGYYVLNLDSDDVTARFGPCFGCPWEQHDEFLEPGKAQRTMKLEPGTYYLRVNSKSDEAPVVTVRLHRQ